MSERGRDRASREMRRKIDRSLSPTETEYEREMDEIAGENFSEMSCREMKSRMLDLADFAAEQHTGSLRSTRFRSSWNRTMRPLVFFASRTGCITDPEKQRLASAMRDIRATLGRDDSLDAVREFKQVVESVL